MKERKILAFERPDLLEEWDFEKNSLICAPDEVTVGSNKKVWWKCPNGHSYEQKVANRTIRNLNCPYCSRHKLLSGHNDLETLFPEVAKEWNYDRNKGLQPKDISARNSNKVWWICKLGHEWEATVASRTDGKHAHGCPYCSNRKLLKGFNDLETKYPNIAKEWHPIKNGDLLPSDVIAGTPKKVWWKCPICGFEYYSQIASRTTMSSNCPNCDKRNKSSFPEQAIFFYVNKVFPDSVNNYHDEWLGKQEIDIYIPSQSVGIEYDGIHWHNSKSSIAKGKRKYNLCNRNNIKIIRIAEFYYPKEGYCDDMIVRTDNKTLQSLENCIIELMKILNISIYPKIDLQRDRIDIISQYYAALKNNSLAVVFPEIAKEWDYENNKEITPDMVAAYSNEQFFWKCKNNHVFKKTVYDRTRQDGKASGCPYCINRKVLKGYNDLVTLHPEVSEEWDFEKNDTDPSTILSGTNIKVWWICREGHSYSQSIYNHVVMRQGCPYCARRITEKGKTDLAATNPELLKEWDYAKNKTICTPEEVTDGSSRIVWWMCSKGHSWKASIYSRAKGERGCPYCANQKVLTGFNDLETRFPNIAKEWDFDSNENCKPNEIAYGSNKKVWWKCSKCGYRWRTSIANRTSNNTDCPRCAKEYTKKKLQIKVRCLETGEVFDCASDAGRWAGVSRSLISACARGKLKHAGKYHWEYVKE